MSGHRLFNRQFRRELLLQVREIRLLVNSCLFFLMILVIFPLTQKPDITLLRSVAPGLIWIAMLLSFLLSSERLFQQDYEHGVIEQWLLSGNSLSLIVGAKVLAHCVIHLIPLLILCPVIAILFSFSFAETQLLAFSLICGTPALLFLCALTAACGIGTQQKGALMALILLPLTLPVLIFGSGILTRALQGFSVSGDLALLLAMSVLAAGFLPFAIAGVIRISHAE